MTSHYHAIVWIDHREARLFHIDREGIDKLVIHADHPTHQVHHKANSVGSGHHAEDLDFLRAVTAALADAKAILIVGPAQAKTHLLKHIHAHAPRLVACIAGVETVDHPSDGALVAYARSYFREDHQMARGG
jgi:stalled ribosome rescue protein Dom34